jgi:heptose I phosphotransferase
MIYVRPDAREVFARETSVADFLRIPSDVVRRFKNRVTGRFVRGGRAYYIKVHHPSGWWPIADELLHLRLPQIGARSEWRALEGLRERQILAPQVVAFGEEGRNPARRRSFLITEEIAPAVSLETLFQQPGSWRAAPAFRRRLIRGVARIARGLHANGINHRDFYLCHFLLNATPGNPSIEWEIPRPYLIDLHRAQKRMRTPRRWIVKDLGGLLFSAMDVDLTRRDLALFIRCYSGRPTRAELTGNSSLWLAVFRRAESLYCKIHQRPPRLEMRRVFNFN